MGSCAPAASTKPHALCMPLPAQGHIKATLRLATLLHSKGFHITFVHTESNYNQILSASGPASLNGSPDFCFETIPDFMTEVDMVSFFASIRDDFEAPFRGLVKKLNEPSSGVPPVTCIVSDSFTSFTLGIAAELGIPDVFFCSVSACSYMGMIQYEEMVRRSLIPLKSESDLSNGYLNTVVDWIPGMKSLPLKDLPTFLQTADPDDVMFNFFKAESEAASRATAIVINTFDEMEAPVLDELSKVLPPIYTVGPLNLLTRQISATAAGSNLWTENYDSLKWLDGRAPRSVVYVNFGSVAVFDNEVVVEFAWGLADSGCDFLWVVRPNIVYGEAAVLPPEFLAKIEGRGFLAAWCPQEEVLAHPAVAGFLTHCGWNSTMECVSAGLPVICFPYFADQQTNCWYLCNEWGMGLRIDEEEVKRERVAQRVEELVRAEKGREMREKAVGWKEAAIRASERGGSSLLNLERLIEEVLLKGSK